MVTVFIRSRPGSLYEDVVEVVWRIESTGQSHSFSGKIAGAK